MFSLNYFLNVNIFCFVAFETKNCNNLLWKRDQNSHKVFRWVGEKVLNVKGPHCWCCMVLNKDRSLFLVPSQWPDILPVGCLIYGRKETVCLSLSTPLSPRMLSNVVWDRELDVSVLNAGDLSKVTGSGPTSVHPWSSWVGPLKTGDGGRWSGSSSWCLG